MSQQPQLTSPSVAEQLWWIHHNGANSGPLNWNGVAEKLRNGQLDANSLLCHVGGSEWKPLGQTKGFQSEFGSPMPPPPPIHKSPSDAGAAFGDRLLSYVDRLCETAAQRMISYRWEAIVCLILYLPTLLLPFTAAALFATGCAYVLNVLLYSQASRLEAILKRPVTGALMLRIMFYISTVILGAGLFVCIGIALSQALRGDGLRPL